MAAKSILIIEAWPPADGELRIYQGSTFDPTISWSANGEPTDWTDHTGALYLTLAAGVTELTTENGGMTLFPNGDIKFFLSDEATALIPIQNGTFKLFVTDPEGNTRLIVRGKAVVS